MQEYPYKKFENTELWKIIDESIDNLVNNQDLEEKTIRKYIVGYLVKRIEEHKKW
jgi:hypothetical protein